MPRTFLATRLHKDTPRQTALIRRGAPLSACNSGRRPIFSSVNLKYANLAGLPPINLYYGAHEVLAGEIRYHMSSDI